VTTPAAAIALAIRDRLSQITTFGGFLTDAGQNVALGWRELRDDAPLPCLTLVEIGHGIDGDAVRGRNLQVRIDWIVEGLTRVQDDALTPLYAIEADVLRALFADDFKPAGRWVRLNYQGRELIPPEDGSTLAAVRIRLTTIHQEVFP